MSKLDEERDEAIRQGLITCMQIIDVARSHLYFTLQYINTDSRTEKYLEDAMDALHYAWKRIKDAMPLG